MSKPALYGDNDKKRAEKLSFLVYALKRILKLLHPFIPFVTEEIYGFLPHTEDSIMISEWPQADKKYDSSKHYRCIEGVKEIIKAVRNTRAEMKVPAAKKIKLYIISEVNYKAGVS